jgi:hypothetical protein
MAPRVLPSPDGCVYLNAMTQTTTTAGFDTVPLPLALHLAMHSVIGLFCAFAGGLNLIDPTKILPQGVNDVITSGVGFVALCGLSWGYVFGVFMGRREVVAIGFVLSAGYVGVGAYVLAGDPAMATFLAAIGLYGLAILARYRARIVS